MKDLLYKLKDNAMNTSIKYGYTPNEEEITQNMEQIAATLAGFACEGV